MASMATMVNHAASGTDGEKFYVFGGRQGGNFPQPGFDTVQVYDPVADTWDSSDMGGSSLTPMPQGRGGTGHAVFYRGEFYVFGGESNVTVFDESFAYDPVANTWREAATMLAGRHGIYPVLFQNRVFVAGGGTSQGTSQSDRLEVFSRL
jgi:N-acetylneuraminic acid mutarotase